jgi:hypothetical protein
MDVDLFLAVFNHSICLHDTVVHLYFLINARGRRRRDRMVVRVTTTCAITTNHHYSFEFEHRSWQGVLDTTLRDRVCQ